MCRRVDRKTPEFRPYIVSRHTSSGLDSASAMEPDHTPKIAMPMTAASVAQRRMGFKAPRAQKVRRSVALPGFPRIQQGGE